jgi:hypothetical protein
MKFVESRNAISNKAVSLDMIKTMKLCKSETGWHFGTMYSILFYFIDGTKDVWDYSDEESRNSDFSRIVNGG